MLFRIRLLFSVTSATCGCHDLRKFADSRNDEQPMTWPDKVSVYHKLRSPPSPVTDSFILDVIVLSEKHQRIAARCEEDIVVYDYRESKKTALKQFMVEKFQETHKLQEETKKKSTARVLDLMRRVEALENESWNRKDAQEDLGSAS